LENVRIPIRERGKARVPQNQINGRSAETHAPDDERHGRRAGPVGAAPDMCARQREKMAREPDTATAASAREPPMDEQDDDVDMAGEFSPLGSVVAVVGGRWSSLLR
jgi:hypothetical protein